MKFPIILPKNHAVAKLMVKYYHEMGVNYTLNCLGKRYFVIHGRLHVHRFIKECTECGRRFRGTPEYQQMAALPRIHLKLTQKPFTNCATDLAGPFSTIEVRGRGGAQVKRYLFTVYSCAYNSLLPPRKWHHLWKQKLSWMLLYDWWPDEDGRSRRSVTMEQTTLEKWVRSRS